MEIDKSRHIPSEIFFVVAQFIHVQELGPLLLTERSIHQRLNTRFFWNLRTSHIPAFFKEIIEQAPPECLRNIPLDLFLVQDVEVLRDRKMQCLWRRKCLFYSLAYCQRKLQTLGMVQNVNNLLWILHSVYVENPNAFKIVEWKCIVTKCLPDSRTLNVTIPGIPTFLALPVFFWGEVTYPPSMREALDALPKPRVRDLGLGGHRPDSWAAPFPKYEDHSAYRRHQQQGGPKLHNCAFATPKYDQNVNQLGRLFDLSKKNVRPFWDPRSWLHYLTSEEWSSRWHRPNTIKNFLSQYDSACHEKILPQLIVCRGSVELKDTPANLNQQPTFRLQANHISYYEDTDSFSPRTARENKPMTVPSKVVPYNQMRFEPLQCNKNYGKEVYLRAEVKDRGYTDGFSICLRVPHNISGVYFPRVIWPVRALDPNTIKEGRSMAGKIRENKEIINRLRTGKIEEVGNRRNISRKRKKKRRIPMVVGRRKNKNKKEKYAITYDHVLNYGDIVECVGRCSMSHIYTKELVLKKPVGWSRYLAFLGLSSGCWVGAGMAYYVFKKIKWPETMKYMIRNSAREFWRKLRTRKEVNVGWLSWLWDVVGKKLIGTGTWLGGTMLVRIGSVYVKIGLLISFSSLIIAACVWTMELASLTSTRLKQKWLCRNGKKLKVVTEY